MLITNIQKLLNSALAGETLSIKEMLPHLDAAIDGINDKLNTCYPVFSDLDLTAAGAEYSFFPDKYIRTVVVPGAAWHYYVMDEEGLQTAPQYQSDFENGKFIMQRDMLYAIPEEFQADSEAGSIIGMDDNDTLGFRGLICDINQGDSMGRWNSPSCTPVTPGSNPQNYNVTDEEKARWNGKQDALNYDTRPVPKSPNAMTSGAIYEAIEEAKTALTKAYKEFFAASDDGLRETSIQLQHTQTGIEAALIKLEEVQNAVQAMYDTVETRTNAALSYRNGSADSAATSKAYADQAFNSANRVQSAIDAANTATEKATAAALTAAAAAETIEDYANRAEVAQGAAETAQELAEEAQSNAESARDLAATSAAAALNSASDAASSQSLAAQSRDDAEAAQLAATASMNAAKNSASAAKLSEDAAKTSENAAANSEANAAASMGSASTYADDAKDYADKAALSQTAALQSANTATAKANAAQNSADASASSAANSEAFSNTAHNYALASASSATEAKGFKDTAKDYMDAAAASATQVENRMDGCYISTVNGVKYLNWS